MKSRRFFYRIAVFCVLSLLVSKSDAQTLGLKTNTLYWAALTPNVGFEIAMSNKISLDLNSAYNPWTFRDDKKNEILACSA